MILDYIILFVLFIEVLLISYFDRRIHGTFFTPVNILSFPYFFLAVIAFFFAKELGFVPFYAPSMIIWIIGLFIFWLPSLVFNYYLNSNKIFVSKTKFYLEENDTQSGFAKFLLILSWISILVVIYGFLISISIFGIEKLGSEEFTRFYGSGFSGHFLVLNVLLFVYFFGIVKSSNYLILLTLLFLLLTLMIYQVKTWIFIPFFSGIFYRYYRANFKMRLKNIWIIILFSVIFFFATYYFSIGLNSDFLFKHMIKYAFSGILGLSEFIRKGLEIVIDGTFLIRPAENIINVITNQPVSSVIQKIMVNISGNKVEPNLTNVRTFFGTVYVNSGIIISIIYILILSTIIYYFYISSILRKNKWVILFSSLVLGALVMGWFDFYFNTLNFFEIPVYILILNFISKLRLRRKADNN
jgi:oligosaccharide repeat unit polymerase